jgi:hypothetical protein
MHRYIYEVIGTKVPKKRSYKGRMDGEYYLVLGETGGLLTSLNKTSVTILELCNGQNSINNIIDIVSEKYPSISKNVIIEDTSKCIIDLQAMNLVTV